MTRRRTAGPPRKTRVELAAQLEELRRDIDKGFAVSESPIDWHRDAGPNGAAFRLGQLQELIRHLHWLAHR